MISIQNNIALSKLFWGQQLKELSDRGWEITITEYSCAIIYKDKHIFTGLGTTAHYAITNAMDQYVRSILDIQK